MSLIFGSLFINTAPLIHADEIQEPENQVFEVPAGAIELAELRNARSKTFELPTGEYQAISNGEIIHYEDEQGRWQNIDLRFREENGKYVIDKSPYIVTVEDNHFDVLDRKTNQGVRWIVDQPPVVEEQKVQSKIGATIWNWTPRPDGVKLLSERVHSRQGNKSYVFNYEPLGDAGSFKLQGNGSLKNKSLTVPAPIVFGADGEKYSCHWTTPNDSQISLNCNDLEWPSSAFPYIIDPTTTAETDATGGSSEDTLTPVSGCSSYNSWGSNVDEADGAQDDSPATNGLTNGQCTYFLYVNSFGFSIPSTAGIRGMEFEIRHEYGGSGGGVPEDQAVHIYANGELSPTNNASSTPWDTNWEIFDYGSSYNYWGWDPGEITPAHVNDSSFGVKLSATVVGGNKSARVDAIQNMKITYVSQPVITGTSGQNVQTTAGGYAVAVTGSNFETNLEGSPVYDTVEINGATTTLLWYFGYGFGAPANPAGTYDVKIIHHESNSSGTYSNGITYIDPPSSPVIDEQYAPANTSGTTRVISGTGIKTENYPARIGSTNATYSSGGSSAVTITIPSLSAGSYPIRVYGDQGADTNGIFTDLATGTIVYVEKPSGLSIDEEYLPANTTGTTRTFSGTDIGINEACPVAVNLSCVSVVSTTTNSVTVTMPNLGASSYNVRVYGENGTNDNEIYTDLITFVTYVTKPNLVSLSDSYIVENTTSSLTLDATSLGENEVCPIKVDGSCATVTATSSNQVTFIAPSKSAGEYELRFFGDNGTDNNEVYSTTTLTYSSLPTVSSIDNNYLSGNTTGQIRTFTGTGMSTDTNPLYVNSVATLGTYSSGSSSSLSVVMPELVPGLYNVRIYGIGGSDSNGIYTDLTDYVVYAPKVDSISPSNVSTIGGETVTIFGQGLAVDAIYGVRVILPVSGNKHYIETTGNANTSTTFQTPASANGGAATLRIYGSGGNDTNGIYIETSSLVYVAPVYDQASYRWFQNSDSSTPGSVMAAANSSTTFTTAGEEVRLRMTIDVSVAKSPAGDSFKLQMASTTSVCSGGLTFNDISPSSGRIRFNDNPSVSDGAAFVSTSTDPDPSGDNISQTYVESNNFLTVSDIDSSDGIWDFSLYNHSAKRGTTYCFRIVKSDGTALDTYSQYPAISVANLQPEVQSVTASQNASGTVDITYEARDPDSDPEAANPGFISPSFEYYNGSSWVQIATSTLGVSDLNDKAINSSTFTEHTATWTPTAQVPGVYNTSAQIRVTVNDSEVNNNINATTSSAFTVDTTDPVLNTVTFDSRNDILSLNSTDNSNLFYVVSNNSDFTADGSNASSGIEIAIGATSVSSSLSWNATGTPSYENIYIRFRDAVSNIATTTIITPATPNNFVLADTSNPGASFYAETLSWAAHTDITSSTVDYYEIWRSTNNTSSFTLLATTTSAFYSNTGLSGSNTYYYKLAAKSTDGNYSEYSSTLGDKPDGSGTSSDTDFTPEFDTTYDSTNQTGVIAYHASSTSDSNWSNIVISYSVRDTDNTSGTINPTYEYNIGSGWNSITTGMNSTSTDAKSVTSTYTTHYATWDASQQLGTSTYSTNLRIRVNASDGSNTGTGESAPTTIDTTPPTLLSTSLLVNGFSVDAEASSSAAYTIQVQNITGVPLSEPVFFAFSNDDSTFYQGFNDGTLATSSFSTPTGSPTSSTSGILSGLSWTWTSGGSALYVRVYDAYGNYTTDSISIIGTNTAPEIQTLSVRQVTSTTPTDGGAVHITYVIRDIDSATTTPSFEYNVGSGWNTIPTSTLNSTSTSNISTGATSTYQTLTSVWSATSTVSSTYTTSAQVRFTLTDSQVVNSSTVATSSFTLDTIAPSVGSNTLLINGSADASESTSTLLSLTLQNVSSTPTGETIHARFSSDGGSTWYGANDDNTVTTSTWGSGFVASTIDSYTWPLTISGRSRTISVEVTDEFGNTPGSDTNTVGYNISPEFNTLYGTNGVSALQDATSSNPTWGQVSISYAVRDPDTTVSSSTPNEVTPSFAYNNGSGWFAITSDYLGSSDLDNKAVDESTYTTHTASWNATSQLAGIYTDSLQLRVTVSDNEDVTSSTSATISGLTVDAKGPSVSAFSVDSRVDRVVLNTSDDTNLSYRLSNHPDLSDDGVNASSSEWIATASTTYNSSSSWSLPATSTIETVYYQIRDSYGNLASGSASAPDAPASSSIQDVSAPNSGTYAELITWAVYESTSTAPFSTYELYRSTTSAATGFYSLTSISDINQNFYQDTGLNASTTYYYRVAIKTTNGDYSDYGDVVSDQPDGLSGSDADGPTLSNVTAAEVHASWARITWDSDRLSSSLVEFGTSTTPYDFSTSTVSLVTSHELFIDGLEQNTTYNFRVASTDINSKQTYSDNDTFTTTGGPIISAVATQSVTDNTATILWNTSKDANSTVVYNTDLQDLREGVDNLTAGNSSLVGAPYQHTVSLSALTAQTTYYYYVQSTDNDNNTTSDKKNGDYYTFTTTQDTKAPTITNVQVAAVTQNAAVITWSTDELSTSQVYYDDQEVSSAQLDSFTTRDEVLTTNHAVTITGLETKTNYWYDVRSVDAAGNASTSAVNTFETGEGVQTIILGSASGAAPIPAKDTTGPIISEIEVQNIEPFAAQISFKTNEESIGFISFGETKDYGRITATPEFKTKHTLNLKGLKLGTTYHFKIEAQDKAGNFSNSPNQEFTTLFAVEDFENLVSLDSVEQFEDQIENLIQSVTPSLITPFIGKITVTDVTENSATINWETNTKTFGSVAYVTDNEFDPEKGNPYGTEVSDTQPKTTNHSVTLNNLSPGTLYHFQIKSFTLPEVVGRSPDRTFITKASKIKPQVSNLQNTSFDVSWQTSKLTSSFVEFVNTENGQVDRTGTDERSTTHVVSVRNLVPDTVYTVKAFGYDTNQNIVESETIRVNTSRDIIAPEITALKIDNTFVPGRNDRIQTVISWKTDEPAVSQVFYEEGSGRDTDLDNIASSTAAYNLNHNVIITNFRPGTIYRIQVVSTDTAGNTTRSPIRAIITPQQTRSVFDVILKNFEDSFRFLQ